MAYAVYNPHGKPVSELPVIYGFNNGGGGDDWIGVLISEDGTCLGSHMCSHEGFMPGDLGVLEGHRADRHEHFKAHHPDGYRMDFVRYQDVSKHEALNLALKLNDEQRQKANSA